MRLAWGALALVLLAGCSTDSEPVRHSLGMHHAQTEAGDGLRQMTDRHSGVQLWVAEQPVLSQNDIEQAEVLVSGDGQAVVLLSLSPSAQALLASITASQIGQPLAILIDGELRMAPIIREPISDGRVALTGFDSLAEANALVDDWSR